jgi:hypothetical protein
MTKQRPSRVCYGNGEEFLAMGLGFGVEADVLRVGELIYSKRIK